MPMIFSLMNLIRKKSQAIKGKKNLDKIHKLENLINALGGVFSAILLSDASERRVFSAAISDKPTYEVAKFLNLGLNLGTFRNAQRLEIKKELAELDCTL